MHEKSERYDSVTREILAVVEGESSLIARMATINCLLSQAFETYFWTGFYMVDPDKPGELVVGPYQGTLGCLRIPIGKGVCGAAAATGETQLVADVHAFAGHIACDSRTNSEIVVPVFDPTGALIAVFDVDSVEKAAFDEIDRKKLESLMTQVFGK
ncbi:GAF domain-containing protein [Emcibacter nanhaiensis]|uniref:GAF domain-containing protein n=1 Tax=Emcibacter nanhaiensis TaxID=1505037 RepID=A0A501PBF9_9PROT|nr:GAF domain-containing protein [Emcibacter nanhaiensis]TPD57690.1 GAF domain-containing protein [Emcibacter nanhaiensis]